jgi:hypothetical protein
MIHTGDHAIFVVAVGRVLVILTRAAKRQAEGFLDGAVLGRHTPHRAGGPPQADVNSEDLADPLTWNIPRSCPKTTLEGLIKEE